MSAITRVWGKFGAAVSGTHRIVRTWWEELDEEPYVVEVKVPSTFDLSALPLKDFRGLLAAYTYITQTGDASLVTHWRTERAYQATRAPFLQKVGALPGTPPAEGHQFQTVVRPPKLGWVRRHAALVIGLLGATAGIAGNIEKVRDPVVAAAISPSVRVTPQREAIDALAGEEFEAEFSVRNISNWITTDIRFSGVTTEPPGMVSLDTPLPGPFIAIKPGSAESVKIHGIAKAVPTGTQVMLRLGGEAENNSKRTTDLSGDAWQKPIQLFVWPRRTVGQRHVEVLSGGKCRLDCQFMIGDEFAKGFEIQAQLKAPEDVRLDRIQFPGNPKLDRLDDPATPPAIVQIRWTATEIKPRKRFQFAIFLTSQHSKSEAEWGEICKRVGIDFGAVPGGKK
jgi:hypothetical protein